MAVTAVTSAALQSQGVEDLSQLSQLAPEVNAGSNSMVVAIRGVRSGISSPTADAATSNATAPYRFNTVIYGAPRTYGFIFTASFGSG